MQNNPAIPCILDSLDRGHSINDLFMVSLGTGCLLRQNPDQASEPDPLSMWFNITQPERVEIDVARNMLSKGAYHRFQSIFIDKIPALDGFESIEDLIEAGNLLVEDNQEHLRDICKILKPSCI